MIRQIAKPGKILPRWLVVAMLITTGFLGLIEVSKRPIFASPGGIQFQWDPDPSFKRLKSFQTSGKRMERSFYYFFLRERERKTGILKLTIKVPDYFKAKIKTENLTLCQAKIGGFKARSKCIENVPAVFEVTKGQSQIDIFPDQPIPVDSKTYAVLMKIRNPRRAGMFQFHGYAQSTGAMPMASYIGSWPFQVE